ncbi:MAG TPA: TetR/AcrR family transcriptional regulator [Gammaproteobacteria bacterium]|nr:TetR/AcrR family transcriptional regulator [Gammaproteobacteria bacterium]
MSTPELILDVAQDMLQKGGLQAFSYRDISSRVGIRTASIHYYYPTKADLAHAIVTRVRKQFSTALAEIDTGTSDPLRRLEKFCGIFLDTLGSADRLCPMCMLAMGQDEIPPAVRREVCEFWRHGEHWVAENIEQVRAQGKYPPAVKSSQLAQNWMATLEGAMVAARAFNERARLVDAIAVLLAGLAPVVSRRKNRLDR